MSKLTDAELIKIGLEAVAICGCLWDDVAGDTIESKLVTILAMPRPGGDADLTDEDLASLRVLLQRVRGELVIDLSPEACDKIIKGVLS